LGTFQLTVHNPKNRPRWQKVSNLETFNSLTLN
jgi:hypothetical protein